MILANKDIHHILKNSTAGWMNENSATEVQPLLIGFQNENNLVVTTLLISFCDLTMTNCSDMVSMDALWLQ